jgi:uncharacterized coiled-coil protein SlyX
MEAKQMAASMLNVEKTQQQFEREILKSSNLPRAQKTVNSQDLVVSPNEKVDGTVNVSDGSAVVNNADITALTARVSTLNDHIARQQQIIERLEHDVAFIRTTLQNLKTESTPVYPKTPTANELLEQKEAHEVSVVNELSDSDAESFISPSK